MRFLPTDLERRILNPKQTRANDNAFKLNAWIYRYFTPLKNGGFLQTKSLNVSDISRVSIAVRHTKLNSQIDNIYIAYIRNGITGYIYSKYDVRLDKQIWKEGTGLEIEADDISIAFNGRYVNSEESMSEFVSDEYFWYFWCKDGVCYANQLFSNQGDIILASSNCSRVAAIKCFSSEDGKFDFGLIVFMVLNGQLYYRQFSNGEWYDGELVSEVSQYILTDIAVARTNDFRIVVQCMDDNGIIHELFTQYQAFAKYNTAFMSGRLATMNTSTLINVSYTDNTLEETNISGNLKINNTYNYYVGILNILSVHNQNPYNKTVVVTLNSDALDIESVESSRTDWSMVDSLGAVFVPTAVSKNGYDIILTFNNFNLASGDCTISYSGTSIKYLSGTSCNSLDPFVFTPTNLNPQGSYAELDSVNTPELDGTKLELVFDQDILNNDVSDNIEFISVEIGCPEAYNTDTGVSPIIYSDRPIVLLTRKNSTTLICTFNEGTQNSIQNAFYVRVSYSSKGTLYSQYGDLRDFTKTFSVTAMDRKITSIDTEKVLGTLKNVRNTTLYDVSYESGYTGEESVNGILGTVSSVILTDTRVQ